MGDGVAWINKLAETLNNNRMKNFMTILFLLFFTHFCYSCVCAEQGTRENSIRKTDVIVLGKIISKELFSNEDHKVTGLRMTYEKDTITVSEIIKGKVKSKTLIIATGAPGGCGYDFKIGKTYLIYADKREDNKKDKFLYTSICTRTNIFQKEELNKVKRIVNSTASANRAFAKCAGF